MDAKEIRKGGAEEHVYQAVISGALRIDEHGRIWNRRGKRAERPFGDYLSVRAMIDGVRRSTLAHRVVFRHFNGPIPDGFEVDHENGVKTDNRPSNLDAVSSSENTKRAHAMGLRDQYGQRNPASTLSDGQIAEIRSVYASGGVTQADIGRQYGVAHQTVSKIIRGERRAKQPGPTDDSDHRHSASERDPVSGRFVPSEDLRVREFPA